MTNHIVGLQKADATPPKYPPTILIDDRYNKYTMPFEFDPNKSESNKQKHGIDFQSA